jgi:hypothetical protein
MLEKDTITAMSDPATSGDSSTPEPAKVPSPRDRPRAEVGETDIHLRYQGLSMIDQIMMHVFLETAPDPTEDDARRVAMGNSSAAGNVAYPYVVKQFPTSHQIAS